MNSWYAPLISLFILFVVVVVYVLYKKNFLNRLSLWSRSLGIDVIPQLGPMELFQTDIEKIIQSAQKLQQLSSSSGKGKKIYREILLDKDLVAKIRETKDPKVVKRLIDNWIKDRFKITGENVDSESKSGGGRKRGSVSPRVKKILIEVNKSEVKKTKVSVPVENQISEGDKKGIHKGLSAQKSTAISSVISALYRELKEMLESNEIDDLMEIVKNLKDEHIEEVLTHYKNSNSHNKFDLILNRSRNAQDVKHFLKMEVINSLKAALDEVKTEVSFARRKGINMKNEELKLIPIPSRIKMFAATLDRGDLDRLKNSLLKIKTAIKIKEQQYELRKKSEKNNEQVKSTHSDYSQKKSAQPNSLEQKNNNSTSSKTSPPQPVLQDKKSSSKVPQNNAPQPVLQDKKSSSKVSFTKSHS